MLDITKMLHAVIDLEYDIDDANEDLLIGPEARRQTIFVLLDVALTDFAKSAGWYKQITKPEVNREQLKKNYAKSLALVLLYCAKLQWTHLVVLDADQWKRITGADQLTKLADLNKEYLAIKHFLNGAYFSHHQEDLRHAWHLLLKMGIVDYSIAPAELEKVYQATLAEIKTELTK